MSVAFPNLSWWLWSGKKRDVKLQKKQSSPQEYNGMELDMVKLSAINGNGVNLGSNSRRKCRNQEEGKVDKELDLVLVPSDGGCSSESESDASDWSIGWSEPHANGFLSEDEIDGGFGVLVRCYGGKQENNGNVPKLYPVDSQKYMQQWLSSLQET